MQNKKGVGSIIQYYLSLLFCCLFISNCSSLINPYTTGAAVLLGGYDKFTKRKIWLGYAEQGDVYAQWELANSYCCNNLEGKSDYNESIKWFCTAAENGFGKAQVIIGHLYRNTKKIGDIQIAKDLVKAYIWFSLAARRANIEGAENKQDLEKILSKKEISQTKEVLDNFQNFSCKNIL